jgi:hypothetical protein
MGINPVLAIVISILMMAATILIGNIAVLKVTPQPVLHSLLIATVCNLLGKLFVSVLQLPGTISYSVPTLAFLLLSYYFFRPTATKLMLYWVVGFVAYLVIHILLSSLLDWSFMFPFWRVRLFPA